MRRQLAALIREHGAHGAQKLAPLPISIGTLLKIAREFGVKLQAGRRARSPADPRRTLLRFDGQMLIAPVAQRDITKHPGNDGVSFDQFSDQYKGKAACW
jgi:hypothetical protein